MWLKKVKLFRSQYPLRKCKTYKNNPKKSYLYKFSIFCDSVFQFGVLEDIKNKTNAVFNSPPNIEIIDLKFWIFCSSSRTSHG